VSSYGRQGDVKQATSEYKILECSLTAERGIKERDLINFIGEVAIFESLFKPYITVNITLIDDLGLLNEEIQFQGTEKVKLKIMGSDEEHVPNEFELELRAVSIVRQQKINNKTTGFTINCISSHAYRDALVKVSRSYYDQLEDIAEKVLDDYLDVKVEKKDDYWPGEPSAQGPVKLILPYISPLDATSWLMERATGLYGGPMFCWCSVWDQKNHQGTVRFGHFPTMIKQIMTKTRPDAVTFKGKSPQNAKYSFVQSQSAVNQGSTYKANKSTINAYKSDGVENSLQMINQGVTGAQISNLDPYSNQRMLRHHNLGELLEAMGGAGTMGTVYDPGDKLTVQKQTKEPAEFDARYINTITSYGTYGYAAGYHDVVDPSMLLNKMRKGTIISALYRNAMDVIVSGYNFTKEELSCGDPIFVLWHSTKIEDDPSLEGALEERRTGHYIVLDLRRDYLSNGKHEVVATIAKIFDDEEGSP
jgi:hypothetical protein